MRSVGLNHTCLENICCIMNIPISMTVKNFNHNSNIPQDVSNFVVQRSMNNAASELKKIRKRRKYFRY